MSELENTNDLNEELARYIESHCSRLPPGQLKVEGCVLPRVYKQYEQEIRDLEVRSDDVWVLSYPKCGTTWTQEMVWLLMNDCCFETAKKVKLPERFPFLEFIGIGGPNNTIEQTNKLSSPRLIKCHLPLQLLPKQIWIKKPKMIYVYRDPRDVAISYFHHMQLWYNFSGSMEKFLKAFHKEVLPYDPFWEHVVEFWKLRNEPNFCFNTFESMKADLGSIIDKTSSFLGVSISEENKSKLIEHLSFSSMQKNESVNYSSDMEKGCKNKNVQFIREGKAGGWKTKLTNEQIIKFDSMSEKYLKNSDFPYYVPNMS